MWLVSGIESLQKSQKSLPKSTIKAPLYPEFDYLFLQESKRRKAIIQKEKEQLELVCHLDLNNPPTICSFGDTSCFLVFLVFTDDSEDE